MRRIVPLALVALASFAPALLAGVATPHRLSFQGLGRNAANEPVVSGDIRVRIYDAATAGNLVYDSGTDFNGALATGVFNVVLGSGTPLLLDATLPYHLELDINGEEVIGDAVAGRQAFWPAGGDQSRADLESRISALEALVFAECGPGQYDLNGNPADGCEFTLDTDGIYVDASDPGANDGADCGRGPVNTCTDCEPCLTITRGLAQATALGRSRVHVANATYTEAVTLVNGKSLLGGYRGGTWERDLGATLTILRGQAASGNHMRAVVGTGITSPTVFEGFVVFGPVASAAGGNSYAIYLANAGGLTVRSNVIHGGIGGPGGEGPAGTNGPSGVAGVAGGDAIQSSDQNCSALLNRSGGAGGTLLCSGTPVSGGAGGGNRCEPVANSEFSGLDGVTASGAGGGTGGDAGDDAAISGTTCTLPPGPTVGAPGGNGTPGTNGAAGTGATNASGSVTAGNWGGFSGTVGVNGSFGRGGGGGGAGGGANATVAPNRDVLGGAGGGGGSGACGGGGGTGGIGGGGSFGIFVSGGTAPVITSNLILRGIGGAGGRGGAAGAGGIGGLGAAGGAASFFCSAPGGRGGDGGSGGHGGGGGGGAGGVSVGIFTAGIGSPAFSGNTIQGGAAGAGGPGGSSPGNGGTAGVSGTLGTIISQ